MADPAGTSPEMNRRQQPFTLYGANGRVYATNVDQKLVDLGALARQEGGFDYLLDGNKLDGTGLPSAEAALQELASRLSFLYLDGQFTALADVRGSEGVNLDGAARLDIVLDELAPGERMEDANV
jgi:hypothetical protein